jgi:hypothetical protein
MVKPWIDTVKKGKVLTVFPTAKVTGEWERAFRGAIAQFNTLSTQHTLGVTLDSPKNSKPPDPKGSGGADVQFDLGNGLIEYEALGQKFKATDDNGNPISFSPFALHGLTQTLSRGGIIEKVFVFVPETPQVSALMKASNKPDDFKSVPRAAGIGIRIFIAVHEFIHACGLSNAEHNQQGSNADVFATGITEDAGAFDKPQDDRLLLHLAAPKPNVFSPPIFLKKRVADLIRDNWK